MQQNVRAECPKCSRPLDRFNGHIGYCSQHKWVSPAGLGFDAEAAEQNRQDAAALQQSRLEAERARKAAETAEIQERHQRAVRKATLVVVALCLVAAIVAFFVIRPSLNYSGASQKFADGAYEEARAAYEALGAYKDAAARVTLCDAMLDLQSGRAQDAVQKLDQLTGEGQGEAAKQLADALLPVIENWQEKGLTPQVLLMLLGKASVIDPQGTLDTAALSVQGHVAMLDGTQHAARAEDTDGDGENELVVLEQDYTITVYRMAAEENVRLAIDNETAAACAMTFGSAYAQTDADAAVHCYEEANRLLPDEVTRAALTGAYRARALAFENEDDMDAAIADARSAMETSGAADDFMFFYDMNLRSCKNGHDTAAAIALWEAFAAEENAQLTRFAAKELWNADAAKLHIAHAAQLAAKKDEGCIAQLRAALALGADVTQALDEVKSYFEPGLTLANLRLLEEEVYAGDAGKANKAREDMAAEVRLAIGEWKERAISAADVPALIYFADQQGIDLTGLDREAIYEEAALAAAGSIVQSAFVNWNHDAYQELLALDAAGKLTLYAVGETWTAADELETKLPGGVFTIADEAAPLVLVLSAQQDELLALTGAGDALSALFREGGISRYTADGQTITFSRLLEGAIERYNDYSYEAVGTQNRPIRTGVDWQQSDYPQPETAAAAVQRYLEARAYDIPEEAALLTAQEAAPMFDLAALDALPAPDAPAKPQIAAYLRQDGQEWFEITYSAKGQTVRTYAAVRYENGWKMAGASDTYGSGQSAEAMDASIALLSFNEETIGAMEQKGSKATYRLLAPAAGRMTLLWQSGEKAASRTSHAVTMQRGSLTGEAVFSYELQPSLNKQQSKDMFISAGVYYVTVEAKVSGADDYSLTLQFDAETNVELESNDVAAEATAVALNAAYSAILSDAKDVDFFAFTLEEPSAVNVKLGAKGSGSKSPAYTYAVMSAADGQILGGESVPGSAQVGETGNLYLAAGTYLVEVKKGSAFTNDEYTLTVEAAADGLMESEHNNTPETADAMVVNADIRGSFGREGDVDCFTFTLENDAVIQPRLLFAPVESGSKTYVLTLMDSNRLERLKVNIGGKESTKVMVPVALEAGTYTVKLENPRFVRQDYTLHLVCMDVAAAEMEPNDTAALAAVLQLGAPRTGILATQEDVDYYKLVFDAQKTVTLKFSFAQTTMKENAFTLTIEQNGKAQWNTNMKGDSGGLEQQLQFPAGEYYIRIKPATWLGAVYTISLE